MSEIQKRFEQGIGAHRAGQLGEAERIYTDVLRAKPSHAGAMQFLGVLRKQQGDLPKAIALLRHAATLAPVDSGCHANLATALSEAGDMAGALTSFNRALDLSPHNAAILSARSTVLEAMGQRDEAVRDLQRCIELEPENFAHYSNLGNALLQSGRADDALRYFDRAAALAPGHPIPLNNRANALLHMQRPEAALVSCQEALIRDPDYVDALHNCGCALLDLDRAAQAQTYFEKAIALAPTYVKSLFNLGVALRISRSYEKAAACFARVLDLSPNRPYALGALVLSLRWVCSWEKLEALDSRLMDALRRGEPVVNPAELLMISDSPALQVASARSYISAKFATLPPPRPRFTGRRRHERLVVAYLSADFHEHATAHLMAELFEKHDRHEFEVIAVSFKPTDGSRMRGRLERAFDRFIDVVGLTDDEVVDALRHSGVHIAVDLKGLTEGNRIGVFARRCAPVQASYLGYPGTTGADFIDYLIADQIVVPKEQQCWYTEKIVYLPDTYQVNDTRREVSDRVLTRAGAGLPEHSFVYCCFNASYKISPLFFAIWMRLLQRTPSSVLWLLDDNEAATRNLPKEALRHGISPDRIVFAPRTSPAEHIARCRLADLFLDTLPVGAHTTASEALWVGLPVLTCLGQSFAGRVAASLLMAAGLPELVAGTVAQYESRAVELAANPDQLSVLRERLGVNLPDCALFNLDRFRNHIEDAYRMMWDRYERGEQPASFAVVPRG